MSHLTKLRLKLTNQSLIGRVAQQMGWSVTHVEEYRSPYDSSYSNQRVANATVLKDKNGNVKLVIDAMGTPTVDPYFMGREHEKFFQKYAVEGIRESASLEGGWISEEATEGQDLVVTVTLGG
jgi:hypothetical protein